MRWARAVSAFAIAAVFFAYGFAVGRYELWPFSLMPQVHPPFFAALPPLATGRSPYHRMREAFFKNLHSSPGLVMLGDSLTEFGPWSELIEGKGTLNRGITGDTSADLLNRIDDDSVPPYSRVLIMVGVNDIRAGVPISRIAANVAEIVARLKEQGSLPVIQSTLLVSQDQPTVNTAVAELNVQLRNYCVVNSIKFVDVNTILAPKGYLEAEYTWDGTHLTGEGYLRWAEVLRPALMSTLAPQR
jgi:lysophospholipase L1-like esterase